MLRESAPGNGRSVGREFLVLICCLAAILLFIFHRSLKPEQVVFANDGPLGAMISQADTANEIFTGHWQPLNWIGIEQPAPPPTVYYATYIAMQDPVLFAKWNVPFFLLLLGIAAWYCFRKLGLHPAACVIGAIAAVLNMNAFSNATWGLPIRATGIAAALLAVAALHGTLRGWWVLRAMLAGTCVGVGIMEGFDVGALFSLWIGAFAFFTGYLREGSRGRKILNGAMQLAVVAVFAAVVSASALQTLIGTQIVGVAGMQQDEQSREIRWNEATQWSLPKIETLRVIIPGLFGYRMESSDGSQYWGAVGQPPGAPTYRHTGSGEYAGVLVAVGAILALTRSRRARESGYDDLQRRYIWFWGIMALLALLFAWGRHAPFYKLMYGLPFFSTIRNPLKFMHLFHLCLLILFAFGMDHLFRRYCAAALAKGQAARLSLGAWWKQLSGFEKAWAYGSVGAVALGIGSWLLFAASRGRLLRFLENAGFAGEAGQKVAAFAQHEILLFVVFLAVAVGLILLIMAGRFAQGRAKIAFALLGLLLFIDLARANQPWILYYDYKYKYASNPLIDTLKERPFERRVTARPSPRGGTLTPGTLEVVYFDWLQNQFQALNIHSLDIVQMPRVPILDDTFMKAFVPSDPNNPQQLWLLRRMWQLCNTRYLIAQTSLEPSLRQTIFTDASLVRKQGYDLIRKPNVNPDHPMPQDHLTVQENPNGQFGLYEYTGALPRAALYSSWHSTTNEHETISRLTTPTFNPREIVIVAESAAPSAGSAPKPAIEAPIKRYKPREIEIDVDTAEPSVLLLNDRYSPNWSVYVDGQKAELLRCNYIMRGVRLDPGQHTVVFKHRAPTTGLWISVTGWVITFGICAFLLIRRRRATVPTAS